MQSFTVCVMIGVSTDISLFSVFICILCVHFFVFICNLCTIFIIIIIIIKDNTKCACWTLD